MNRGAARPALVGLMVLAACAQTPAAPAYVEVPWPPPQPLQIGADGLRFPVPFPAGGSHRAHLTPAARDAIHEAVGAWQHGGFGVVVMGYGDDVHSAAARARAVTRALVQAGIPEDALVTGFVPVTAPSGADIGVVMTVR